MKDRINENGFNNPYDHNDNPFSRFKARQYNLGYVEGEKYVERFQLAMQLGQREWN